GQHFQLKGAHPVEVLAEIQPAFQLFQVLEVVMPSAVAIECSAGVAMPQPKLGHPWVRPDLERPDALALLLLNRGVKRAVRAGEGMIITKGEQRLDAEPARPGGSVTNYQGLLAVSEEDLLLQLRSTQIKRPDWKRIESKFRQLSKPAGVKRAGVLIGAERDFRA